MNNSKFGPLTTAVRVGTMKEGGEGRSPEQTMTCAPKEPDTKFRRPEGPTASYLAELLLRLHTFARDWSQVADDAEASLLSAFCDELAALTKEEYDRLHG